MLQQQAFHPPMLTQDVQALFKKFDEYDDPYLCFLQAKNLDQWRYQTILNALQEEEVSASGIYHISGDISFFLCFTESTSIQVIADEIVNEAKEIGISAYLSVFRHNCLGKPKETFNWGVSQLKKLVETSSSDTDLAINDFTDKANWPGISEYIEQDKPKLAKPNRPAPKQEPKSGWLSGIARRLGLGNHTRGQSSFELTDSLLLVQPFVKALPNGKALWNYVLTGQGKEKLDKDNAFVDLDRVIFLVHASKFAPEFYHNVLIRQPYDSIPDQRDLHEYFDRVIIDLIEELLESDTDRRAKQACFLRLLDIFYHIFDQQTWSEEIYEIVVENEDSACLTEAEFKARYSPAQTVSPDTVSAEAQQSIMELLDDLEDYFFCSSSQWREIEKLFADNRLAINPEHWQGTEDSSRLLLASILLYKDKQARVDDNNTQALRELIDELLLPQILEQIESELRHDQSLPEDFVAWLKSDDADIYSACIERFQAMLEGDSRASSPDQELQGQVHTDLFDHTSDFLPVLASCYWLQLSEPNLLTQKIIAMALSMAPQATLSCFTHLQMKFFGSFSDDKQQRKTLRNLKKVGSDAYDLLTFEVRLTQSHDIPSYEKLVKKYAKLKKEKQQLWDRALAKIMPATRDYFYLDVYRIAPKVATPLLALRPNMLDGLIRATIHYEDDFIKAMFNRNELLFSDRREYLSKKYDLPIVVENEVVKTKLGFRFAWFILENEKLKLIAISDDKDYDAEEKLLNYASYAANFYAIFSDEVERESLIAKIQSFADYEGRKEVLKQGMLDFFSGKLTFQQYQTEFGHYSSCKDYDIYIKDYGKHYARILPQILAEPDEQVKLRFVKLLSSHKTRGKQVLRKIAEHMFFDHYLTNGSADFEMRHDPELEVEDLTEDWIERWQDFHKELEQKVMAVE